MNISSDAYKIIDYSISRVLPGSAVRKALALHKSSAGKTYIVAIGKAAYSMAKEAGQCIDFIKGIVITKYGHSRGPIDKIDIYEAGHPIADENSLLATEKILEMTGNLSSDDAVVFLVSGGGSALFEKPAIPFAELQEINEKLIKSGAGITEINTVRKKLSMVKGGRFAKHCRPAKIFSIILSDIVGDPLDQIASGPAFPDSASSKEALLILGKYGIEISDKVRECLERDCVGYLDNVTSVIAGNVNMLCEAAKEAAISLGYEAYILKNDECGIARDVGEYLANKALDIYNRKHKPSVIIVGGETVVRVTGSGLGGRNQEIALSACRFIAGKNIVICSISSDGTDGPTDAAGGLVDGSSMEKFSIQGINVDKALEDNNSYWALDKIGALVKTGPTGTNVNDISFAIIP